MATFTQLLTSGLALGAVYALIALGFVVIYRASQVFNFAHGELLAFGALVTVSLAKAGAPWALAVLLAMVATGLLGALIERVALRPLVGRRGDRAEESGRRGLGVAALWSARRTHTRALARSLAQLSEPRWRVGVHPRGQRAPRGRRRSALRRRVDRVALRR